ncbi:MAG TPA: SusD/RagB family nutrient-binding outer membrane lipoprotein, partial [Ohtaekwangia sp.]|nr:SusD/RagB family nutrient-binding outer membrane lipoprotein [Ohtaekwangia sp.]
MKKFNICLTGLLLLISASCNDFLDVNTSPNEPSTAPVELVFPAATGSTAYVIGGWYQILGGMWAQHWTQSTGASQYRNVDSYDLQNDAFDDRQYGELYSGAINDLEYIRTTAKAEENWSYYLMATVVQSYTYQVLVDLYDKVPFTDALKGVQGTLTPKFDDGQVIYDSLIQRLDYALSKDIHALTAQIPDKDDVIFQGDLDKWVQFANTLKLKIFMRESIAREAVAQAGVQALFAEPNFLEEDASFKAFKDEVDNRNPVYETGVDRLAGNLTISRTLFNFLSENSDPRINSIMNYPTASPGTHNTLEQGNYLAASPVNIAGLSTPKLAALD